MMKGYDNFIKLLYGVDESKVIWYRGVKFLENLWCSFFLKIFNYWFLFVLVIVCRGIFFIFWELK